MASARGLAVWQTLYILHDISPLSNLGECLPFLSFTDKETGEGKEVTNVLLGQGSVSTVPFRSVQRITFTQPVFNSGHPLGSQLNNLNVAVQAPACFLVLRWLDLKKEQPKREAWKRPVS